MRAPQARASVTPLQPYVWSCGCIAVRQEFACPDCTACVRLAPMHTRFYAALLSIAAAAAPAYRSIEMHSVVLGNKKLSNIAFLSDEWDFQSEEDKSIVQILEPGSKFT
ncbi:hypothetical protein ACTXT7_006265 [Hymenolepis weldensis]